MLGQTGNIVYRKIGGGTLCYTLRIYRSLQKIYAIVQTAKALS